MLIARSTEIRQLPFMSPWKVDQGDVSLMSETINAQ